MSTAATTELERLLGTKVLTDPDRTGSWSRDQSPLADVGTPLAVVRATSTDDVVATLRVATSFGVPVVTRGAGSGLAGGANASDGCILLSVEGMDEIVEIDPARRTATVQPGVINSALGRAAAEHGLRYTPDPGSRDISSIGGNIATNAGGMTCCKYGVTADHVASLVAVLPDGTVVRTGATTRKNVTGLDLTRLLIGSEGTLAVVVEATVWLKPVSEHESTIVAMFPTVDAAVQAVVATTARTTPSAMELMDRTTIAAVNALTGMGIDAEAEAVLLITCDGPAAATEAVVCEEVASAHGATEVFRTDDRDEGAELMNARRMALPALEKQGSILLDDVGVPVGLLPDMVAAIAKVSAEHDVVVGTFGHAADGNLHPTIIFDPADDAARQRAREAFADIVRAALALGGTVSGEHGIGSLKLPFVTEMYGAAEIALMHRVKAAFDPDGIMNPGRGY
ncbi:MAG: FAD-linked oxidase C-terminal domain-containing protein [Nocardioidaceae bacterium]|nr:FAD-linked oxidase C-terminal domain-containing protein [Nocardioidaceae bacterium]